MLTSHSYTSRNRRWLPIPERDPGDLYSFISGNSRPEVDGELNDLTHGRNSLRLFLISPSLSHLVLPPLSSNQSRVTEP